VSVAGVGNCWLAAWIVRHDLRRVVPEGFAVSRDCVRENGGEGLVTHHLEKRRAVMRWWHFGRLVPSENLSEFRSLKRRV